MYGLCVTGRWNKLCNVDFHNMCSEPDIVNPLNAELNPICHLLTLLGAHHILHFSRIRVNLKSRGAERVMSGGKHRAF
jgi:hypothetical protein